MDFISCLKTELSAAEALLLGRLAVHYECALLAGLDSLPLRDSLWLDFQVRAVFIKPLCEADVPRPDNLTIINEGVGALENDATSNSLRHLRLANLVFTNEACGVALAC